MSELTNEQIVAGALARFCLVHEEGHAEEIPDVIDRDRARAVLEALSAAGRLIPEGSKVDASEEVRLIYGEDGHVRNLHSAEAALYLASPELGDRVETRSVMNISGPWVEVPGD